MNFLHSIGIKHLLRSCALFLAIGGAMGLANSAQAADTEAPKLALTVNAGDNAWLLASSALVLMMTAPGLILFYGGLGRAKKGLFTHMQNLIFVGLVFALWV